LLKGSRLVGILFVFNRTLNIVTILKNAKSPISAPVYVTKEGLERLKEELHHLIAIERPAISKQIAEARDKGDLSENAEYDAAKEAQGLLELKISKKEEEIILKSK
jgi:hypothetical protein